MPKLQQDQIEEALLSTYVKWDFYPNTNSPHQSTQENDAPQFVHGFIKNKKVESQYLKIPTDIMAALDIPAANILRAKANLLMWEPKPTRHPKHIDENDEHCVFVYYVNDSDGDTVIYQDGEALARVSPKKGRGVMFDGSLMHASTSPTDHRLRLVINFNILPGNYLNSGL